MSLLGKIFAILNILGVAGFFYVASLNYAKRQTWAFHVFRQDLKIQGLPLDANERTAGGQPIVDLINEDTRKSLFPQPPVVLTQEDEVKRYKNDVQTRLQGATDTRKALYEHATLLLPFAQTSSERELLLADLAFFGKKETSDDLNKAIDDAWKEAKIAEQAWKDANPNPPPDRTPPDLRDLFESQLVGKRKEVALPLVADLATAAKANQAKPILELFDAQLEAQRQYVVKWMDKLFFEALGPRQDQSPDQRRRVIARLLFGLAGPLYASQGEGGQDVTTSAVYDRYLNVVGLQEAVPAIHEAAQNLTSLAKQVDAQRTQERGLFALEHHRLLNRIEEVAERVEADRALYARKQQQKAIHEEEMKKRQREVREYEDELRESRRLTAEQIQALQQMTDALYKERVKLRNATEENQKLEKQIRALESGR
jgi:hypothetical protein